MFAEFALHERLLKVLAELGFATPTPVQAAAIPLAMAGRDLRVTAQTGSGKTAAFLLPLLHYLIEHPDHRAGTRAVILLPTRELARQTQKTIEQLAAYTFIKSELITGGEDFKVQAARMRRNPDILVGTPGRLLEHQDAGHLVLDDLVALVLDEADRMLDMGFKDDVLRLAQHCNANRQTLLFSATPGGEALTQVAAAVLRDPEELMLNSVRDAHERIQHQVITADDIGHKEALLRWLLDNEQYDKAIIFTNTREQADRLGGVLRTHLRKVFVLHGEKDQRLRKLALDRLRSGEIKVLVATDVAARGLDIDGLDLVINFEVPRSGDEYLHRVGRTGRLGNTGLAITLVAAHEWNLKASIERYLRQSFEQRLIEAHPGHYRGPKKLKASGKAAGSKKKKLKKAEAKKNETKRAGAKAAKGTSKPKAAKRAAAAPDTRDGYATPRKKPARPLD